MPRWSLLLGGPLIWATHFGAIYAAASVSHVAVGATTLVARVIVVSISAVCLLGCAWLVVIALRQPNTDGLDKFWRAIAALGAVLAGIAIIWQTAPVFFPLEGTAAS